MNIYIYNYNYDTAQLSFVMTETQSDKVRGHIFIVVLLIL